MSGITLPEVIEKYGSEDRCHAFLEELRWPDGVKCPRCDSDKISRIVKRRQFDCDGCRYQFSVRVDTIFHDSKLPLWKWFLAVYMMVESKKGISANQLSRMLGVSYKTAWYLCHRIRSTMTDESGELLSGIVEADETFIGGKKRFPAGTSAQDRALHRRDNKTVVLGAVERGGDDDTRHEYVDHSRNEWVRGQIHTNTVESVWSLFDRSVIGAYHKLSVKHLPAYLDEAAFRWNNRSNPNMFRDTILALVEGDTLTYSELTAK